VDNSSPASRSWRERDGVQQRVGDAPAGGQHHGLARVRGSLDDVGDAPETIAVGDARTAKLVYHPLVHISRKRRTLRGAGAIPV
jgi:hypothetical protein